jgi:membrane fusion protein, adhesin transport system
MQVSKKINQHDLDFMSSLSQAVLQQTERKSKLLLNIIVSLLILAIIWANFAQIDEITRAEGNVIPSSKIQVIQNLEGGIVSDIMINEGDIVSIGDALIKIDNKKEESNYQENRLKLDELEGKLARLKAESDSTPFKVSKELQARASHIIANEKSLYRTNQNQMNNQLLMVETQIAQKIGELKEAISKSKNLKEGKNLLQKEINIMKPLVKNGIEPRIELLKREREMNGVILEIEELALIIPRLRSSVMEVKSKIKDTKLTFKNRAKEEYNEVYAQIDRIRHKKDALADQVGRTLVKSPVHGTIKQLFVNTIGGVVRPGMDLIEIVPNDDALIIEAKVKPSDVAFLFPNQKAIVKFTAYDFSIYGGLEGRVIHIGADTIKDEEKNLFYMVKIKTDKNFLGTAKKRLAIISGMTVNVDILTGKKTIMDYILKPILKAKNNALTER